MPSLPSIAPDFSVSLAPPSRTQPSTPSQDADSQPFAALLEASAPASAGSPAPANPPPANPSQVNQPQTNQSQTNQPQANQPQVTQPTWSPVNGNGGNLTSWAGISATASNVVTANASSRANAKAATAACANGGAAKGNVAHIAHSDAANGGETADTAAASPNASEQQNGTAAAADAPSDGAELACAAQAETASASSAATVSAATTSSTLPATVADALASLRRRAANDVNNDAAEPAGSSDTTTPAVTNVQPMAAAIAPTLFAATSTTATGPAENMAGDMAIGELAHGRTNAARFGSQNGQSSQPAAAAGQQSTQAASATNNGPADGAATNSSSAAATTAASLPDSVSSQQTPADTTASPSLGGIATADTFIAHVDAAAAAGSAGDGSAASNAQTALNAVKSATAELPNFVVAANAAAQSVTPASTAAPATAVSVAGLPIAIAARAAAGSNQFDIRLDPPELGRIDVRLGVDADGQVTSHVTVDRPETLALLQSQQPQLERALEQAGLKTADNGLQFSLRDQSFAGQNNGGGSQSSATPQLVIPDATLSSVETTRTYTRWGLGGGVDIRV